MSGPGNFKLPTAEADAFAFSSYFRPPYNVDPAWILTFLPQDTVTQVIAQYQEYLAVAADLHAQTFQAQAQFHKRIAGIIGKSKQ